jgi:ABC-type amino acid transport substrate-binding protein
MRLPTVLLAVTCLAGAASAEDLSGTLQKVKETKKITLGYQEASVPFSYLDGNQKPVGFAMDICLKIVDAVKKQLNMPDIAIDTLAVTSSNRIPLMVNGTLDLHCSATTNNADRQKQVAFTNTHFLSATRFAAKKAANINTIDDLKGKAVTAVAGSVNLNQLAKVNTERNLGIRIMPAVDQAEAFLLLETDRAQAYALEGAGPVHDQRRDVCEGRAVRDHAAAGGRAVQGAGRSRHRRALCNPGDRGALPEVAGITDAAERHQLQRSDLGRLAQRLQEPELERRSGRLSGEVRRGR